MRLARHGSEGRLIDLEGETKLFAVAKVPAVTSPQAFFDLCHSTRHHPFQVLIDRLLPPARLTTTHYSHYTLPLNRKQPAAAA